MCGVCVGSLFVCLFVFEMRDSLRETVKHVIFSWNVSVSCKHA